MKTRIEIVSRGGSRKRFVRKWIGRAALVVGAVCIAGSASGDYYTSFTTAVRLYSGWANGRIGVVPEGEVENNEGCGLPDMYQSDPMDDGHKERTALILSAYLTGFEMQFRISGCTDSGRPKIIMVGVQ